MMIRSLISYKFPFTQSNCFLTRTHLVALYFKKTGSKEISDLNKGQAKSKQKTIPNTQTHIEMKNNIIFDAGKDHSTYRIYRGK